MMRKELDDIMQIIIDYRDAQGWQDNDRPNNLSKSIFIESTELLKNFDALSESYCLENIKEELADILMYTLAYIHDLELSAEEIILERIKSL